MEMKTYRDNFQVEIRKQSINKQLKRARESQIQKIYGKKQGQNYSPSNEVTENLLSLRKQLEDAAQVNNFDLLGGIVKSVRKLVSPGKENENVPFKEAIKAGILPHLVSFASLRFVSYPLILNNALWALSNITTCDQIAHASLFQFGLLSNLKEILENDNLSKESLEHIFLILGNLVGESEINRQTLINLDIFRLAYERAMENKENYQIATNAAFLFSNSLNGPPHLEFDMGASVLKLLLEINLIYDSPHIQTEVIWAVNYFLQPNESKDSRIAAIFNYPYSADLLTRGILSTKLMIQRPALRSLGMLSTGDNCLIEILFKDSLINALFRVLRESKTQVILIDALWIFSNLISSTDILRSKIVTKEFAVLLVQVYTTVAASQLRSEILSTISTLMICCTPEQILLFINHFGDFLKMMLQELEDSKGRRIEDVLTVLTIIESFCKTRQNLIDSPSLSKSFNLLFNDMLEMDELKYFEELQSEDRDRIATRSQDIMTQYFETEEGMTGS